SLHCPYCVQFYFNDPPTTATYTLSLHDALPICRLIAPLRVQCSVPRPDPLADPDVPKGMSVELLKDLHLLTRDGQLNADARRKRSEEHTSELQSQSNLVCRLLLEKKKKKKKH